VSVHVHLLAKLEIQVEAVGKSVIIIGKSTKFSATSVQERKGD
jgi:hypothetical protein